MEVGEKTGKRGFAVNRCTEFTLGTRYVYVKERQFPVTLNFRSERYIGVLLVEIFKEKRYVVQGSEKKKAVINISSVEYRLERRRAALVSDLFMNTLAKSGPNGLPIATPSTCWYKRPLKIKLQFITDSDRSL